jgi:hypothetical protein
MGIERAPGNLFKESKQSDGERRDVSAHAEAESADSDAKEAMPEKKDLKENQEVEKTFVINNRPSGEQTERPVFNVEGLKDKDVLSLEDIADYAERDRAELTEVAGEMKEALGKEFDAEEVKEFLFKRMLSLCNEALKAERTHGEVERGQVKEMKIEHVRLQDKKRGIISRLFMSAEDKERMEELERQMRELYEQQRQRASFVSGKEYFVHETTAYRQRYPARDVVLLFKDTEGKARALRLNLIQIGLAEEGVYYKGEPSDNSFRKDNMKWDQAAYPTSPKAFYEEHVKDWVRQNPEEARALLGKQARD